MAHAKFNSLMKRQEKNADAMLSALAREALRGSKTKGHKMTAQQIRAAELYLSKVRPSLRSIQHTGQLDHEVEVIVKIEK